MVGEALLWRTNHDIIIALALRQFTNPEQNIK
jgi:hypothetical protein